MVRKWGGGIVRDGSLPDSGFEITTAPANGDLFARQIEDICTALNDQNAEVSPKCGYHVHIDGRDYSCWDIRKLVLLYAKIESALFETVPKSRRDNHYFMQCADRFAVGLVHSKDAKNHLLDNVYAEAVKGSTGRIRGQRVKQAKANKYGEYRYYALNLHSWFYRGTIECRLAAGTTNPRKIINWGLLWASILDYAAQHSEAAIRSLGHGWPVLLKVAASDDVRAWLTSRKEKFTGNDEE